MHSIPLPPSVLVAAGAALLAAAALPLGGCAAGDDHRANDRDRSAATRPALDAAPKISILAPELRASLDAGSPLVRGGGDLPLEVEIDVRNVAARTYLVEYRYRFFAADGFEERSAMPWTFQSIDPGTTVTLHGASLSSGAVDYRLEIRWSR